MSELKQVGIIERIGDVKVFSEKFKALEFTLTIEGDYPQSVKFQVSQDRAEKFNEFNKVGDSVEVLFNLRGRNWTNKEGVEVTFNTLDAWRVNQTGEVKPTGAELTAETEDMPF